MPAVSTYSATANSYLNGLLGGAKWAVGSLTYSFPTSGSYYGSGYGDGEPTSGFGALSSAQQSAVRNVFSMYAAVTNLSFTEITETSSQHADLRYAGSSLPDTAWGYYPSTASEGGDSWYGTDNGWYSSPVKGNYAWATFIHETGHALGLKHPHETSGGFNAMPADHDSLEYSVMSYRSYVGASTSGGYTNGTWDFPQTLMMEDVRALQYLYGADYTTNSGNTVYSWSPTTGEMSINGVGQGAPGGNRIFMTVWDGGGYDTYDFSSHTTNLVINLAPGGWTTTSSAQLARLDSTHYAAGNVANALLYQGSTDSLIENAVGGSGADTIYGNEAVNTIYGNGGADRAYGYAGNDWFFGAAGNDYFDGGTGIDIAYFAGAFADYTRTRNSDGSWNVVDIRSGSPDSSDSLINVETLQFSDRSFSTANSGPAAAISNQSVHANQWLQLGGLLSSSDAEGNAITHYQFMDSGMGTNSAYLWTLQNSHHAADSYVTVAASEINSVWLRGGQTAGSENMWVRAFDGSDWGAWDVFTVTTLPNTPPQITVADQNARTNEWVRLNGLLSTSDADGNAITQYQFYDAGAAASSAYLWTPQNSHHAADTYVTVAASDIGSTWVRGGQTAGSEVIWVRAFDGSDWSAWDAFTFTTTPNTRPTVAISDHTLAVNQWATVAPWLSTADADGDAITQYQFYDAGAAAGSAYFWTPQNTHHAADTYITVATSDIGSTWVRGGQATGSELMWVRAFDGTDWGAWDSFYLVTA